MTTAYSMTVNKTKLTVETGGCIDCGTIGSHEWHPAKKIDGELAGHKFQVTLYRCAECFKNNPENLLPEK